MLAVSVASDSRTRLSKIAESAITQLGNAR